MPHHVLSKLAFLQTLIITAVAVACLIAVPARADLGDELFKLTASDAAGTDTFGISVGVSDNVAIVGAHGFGSFGNNGAAYLFDVTTGQELFKLAASDAAPQRRLRQIRRHQRQRRHRRRTLAQRVLWRSRCFRRDHGTRAVQPHRCGKFLRPLCRHQRQHRHCRAAGGYGAAYLFDVTTGEELFNLTATDAPRFDQFGYAVAISGNTAIVGAIADGDAGVRSGSAYLFDVTTGRELFKLTASDAAPYEQFGSSVGISGNAAIVGLSYDIDGLGSAYVFDVDTGLELYKLTASDAAPYDRVQEVAISGKVAIVGSPEDADGGSQSGSAYLYDVTTGRELAKLTASDAAPGDFFGHSVAISGKVAIVGAYGDGDGAYTGAVYVFSTVPEPGSIALLAVGLPFLAWRKPRPLAGCGRRFVLSAITPAYAAVRSDQ